MAWFGLPKRAEYILRSLICIAKSDCRLPVRAIAACEHIPPSFLAQILYQLTWQGLVSSKRGPGGGFVLALPPEEIRVKHVLEIFQGPPTHSSDPNPAHDFSQTWEKLWEPTRHALETLTLADLLHTELAVRRCKPETGSEGRVRDSAPRTSTKRKTKESS